MRREVLQTQNNAKMMISSIRRSATTLLAISTRRNLILSSSTFASLVVTASPFTSSAIAAPSRYNSIYNQCTDTSLTMSLDTGYLNAKDAADLDAELMSTPGFSLEQLMELAGLSVAEAVYDVAKDIDTGYRKKKYVLLVCGPGNNGGDGLVAARHLVHFGFDATIVYPKRSAKTHFINLVKQCEDMGIPILDEINNVQEDDSQQRYDIIVDAIFGFSFHGTAPREPFASIIANMVELQKEQGSILVSVDVPSGWNVDGGDLTGTGFSPDVLISLTAPKLSAKKFKGRHFVGGRFLPPAIAEKYNIRMPPYPGVMQIVEIANDVEDNEEDWGAQYQAYLEEQELKNESDEKGEAKRESKEEDWAIQYQAHVEEKEKEFFESNKPKRII